MKSEFNFKKAAITLFAVFFSVATFAQTTGKVSGTVTDKKTNETLIGVSVKIEGTNKGVATDVEGRYLLGGLSSGKYTLLVSYIGYDTKRITEVEIAEGKVTTLNVILAETNSAKLNDVVVTAKASKESINTLYANQKTSMSISSGISAELIKKSPDKNTSDVLKRVSGASIQDNKFVIVRGLSDRYNSALLNNSILPNTEVDKRAFSFDILPSNLIDAIVVNKTASADIPADFSGGVVQVTTKDFPDTKFLDGAFGTSYNTQSTFKNFISTARSGREYFGTYNKNREIPSGFPSAKAYQSIPGGSTQLARLFTNNWGYSSLNAKMGSNAQLNFGNSKVFDSGAKFGSLFSVSYRYDERLKTSDQQAWSGQALGDVFHDNVYNSNTNIGGLANFAYSFGKNKIGLKNLYNRVLERQFTNREGVDDAGGAFIRSADYLLQRTLISNQLTGDHLLSEASKIKLDWNLNYANTERKEPGFKRMDYSKDGIASIQTGSADPRLGGNFSSVLNENSYGAATNVTIPVKLFKDKSKVKLGYLGQYRQRDFSARVIGFIRNGGSNFETSLLSLPLDKIFAPENIRTNGFTLSEITNNSDAYKANSLLNAGYAMFDGFLTDKIRLGIGARLESYNLKLNSANGLTPVNVDTTAISLLPSANLIYNLTEKTNLRFSASQTVGRPEFREIAPFSFYDFNKNVSVSGNEHLKQSKTTNVDLGYAFYPNAGEVISFSTFFKYFNNPIEQALILGTSGRAFSYMNASSATVYGAEIEFRKSLKSIAEQLSNFTFNTNLSYIKSRVMVPYTVNKNGERPLQGQSPYLINAGLQYTSKAKNSTGASLLFNRVGKRIWAVGNVQDGDIYENPRNVLDFQLSQKVAKSRGEIKVNFSDILNNKAIYFQQTKNSNINKDYNASTDHLNFSDRFGSTISIGFTYKIK